MIDSFNKKAASLGSLLQFPFQMLITQLDFQLRLL